jgi:protein O-GlcNAc transferase
MMIDSELKNAIEFYHADQTSAAEQVCRQLLEICPKHPDALHLLGVITHRQGRYEDAIGNYQKAIGLKPSWAEPYFHMGSAFHDQGRLETAISCYRKALDLKPDFLQAHVNLGIAYQRLKQFNKALSCFEGALNLEPDCAEAYINMGNLYQAQARHRQALTCYRQAVHIEPENPVAHLNLGIALKKVGNTTEAAASYRRALNLKPDYAKACAYLVNLLQSDCDWSDLAHWSKKLDALTGDALACGRRPAETPFLNISRHADPALNMAVVSSWCDRSAARISKRQPSFDFTGRLISDRQRITIGYLSNNFRNHPTAHLMYELFRLQNRRRFEVFCYSYGNNDGSSYRNAIQHDCDRFVELDPLSPSEAAQKIFADRVDILVDLAGHTQGNRMEICALRPAPVQVRYLGMPGTTGAEFFDYLIADPIVTPGVHARHYSEKLVWLPHCYQINSRRQCLAGHHFKRGNQGLPDGGFVFCCFNTSYKFDPVMFDGWMRILKRVAGSVFWLMAESQSAASNLKREAEARGVDAGRLVLAAKLPKDEHLARLRLANLALDTRIVNGAITTSDALWSGVPVVTLLGDHFASRMSASILTAIGLPQMVATRLEQYESLAVGLANHPHDLARIKETLAHNRRAKPLFNTRLFVKHLEYAYARIWQNFMAGDNPGPIRVPELRP